MATTTTPENYTKLTDATWPGRKSMEAEFFTEALGTAKPKEHPLRLTSFSKKVLREDRDRRPRPRMLQPGRESATALAAALIEKALSKPPI